MNRDFDDRQSKYWVFTSFNHVDKVWWEEAKDGNECWEAGRMQLEVCPKSGKDHVQGFLILHGKRRFSVVQRWLPGVHLELMRGTPRQAWVYASKLDSRADASKFWELEWGECPKEQERGKRTDLEAIRDAVAEGKDNVDVIQSIPGALRYMREMDQYRSLLETKKPRMGPFPEEDLRPWQKVFLTLLDGPPLPRRIFWIWSEHSNVGKTSLMQFIAAKAPGRVLCATRDLAALLLAYAKQDIIWFNFPREVPLDALTASVLETISDGGFILSTKYYSTQKYVRAHVVVTCNRGPPLARLPKRCVELRLDSQGLLAAAPHCDFVGPLPEFLPAYAHGFEPFNEEPLLRFD